MCLCSLRSEWICCHQLALFLWQASAASLEPLPLSLDFRRGFLHVCPALSFWSRPQGALWDVITTYHNNDPMAVVAKAQVCNSACNTSSSGTVKESMRLRHSFGESISSSAHENITIAVLSCDEERTTGSICISQAAWNCTSFLTSVRGGGAGTCCANYE